MGPCPIATRILSDKSGRLGCSFGPQIVGLTRGHAGVAFANRDGSFTFKLDILPQTKFQLREEAPADNKEAAAE